jgi:hypothetical protein
MLTKNKRIALVFLIFIIPLSIMQFTVPHIIGFDGYSHIKTADIIKQKGFIKEFPWAKYTILSDNYADIQVLFRVFLIPFTFLGLALGAKIAAILFASLCFAVFYWFLAENRIRYAFFWSLLYLFTAETLMYRFLLPRQMPLVITLLIFTIYFLKKRKYLLLSIVSLVYALLYSGFIIQLFMIFLYFILTLAFSKKFDYRILLYSLIGTILGLMINPYFPNNMLMLYTQIFKVNFIANLYNVEWKAWPFFEFIKNNVLVLFYFILASIILARNKKITKNTAFYLLLSLFFLVYTLKSRRMQEYLVPFSILMLVFFSNGILRTFEKKRYSKYVKTAALATLAILIACNFILLRNDVINNTFLYHYDGCADWLSNVPKGSLIFINAYSFNYLFFKNSDMVYTHGMDLTYSYLQDPGKFERYMAILRGTTTDTEDFIVEDYNPSYIFAGKMKQDMELYKYIVSHKENYKVEYEDDWCAVLKVR